MHNAAIARKLNAEFITNFFLFHQERTRNIVVTGNMALLSLLMNIDAIFNLGKVFMFIVPTSLKVHRQK